MSDVPQGTITEVLSWVDGDPQRAQQALEAEQAGANRSTLIASLQAIAERNPQEAAVTEDTTTVDEAVEEAEEVPAPVPPTEVSIDPEENATVAGAVHLRDPDVEAPDTELEAASYEPVESIRVVSGGNGVVIFLAGEPFAFNTQQALALRGDLNQAIAGLNY